MSLVLKICTTFILASFIIALFYRIDNQARTDGTL